MKRLGPQGERAVLVALAIGPFLALSLPFLGYVPIFDARQYADCAVGIARGAPFPFGYACATHPTLAWAALIALPLRVFGIHPAALHAMSLALGVWGILAFRDIVERLFPGDRLFASLAAATLGAIPMLVASALNCNPDFGCAVFFLVALRELLAERPLRATFAGVLLVFSKETGIVLWALLAGLWLFVFVLRADGEPRAKLAAVARSFVFALPLGLFVLYSAAARHAGGSALWKPGESVPLHDVFTRFRLFDPNFLGVLACLFVLQFLWIPATAIAARWLAVAARWSLKIPDAAPRGVVLCDLLLIASVLALSRYRTFVNPRYYAVLYALVLLAALSAVHALAPRRLVRLGFLGVLLCLFAASVTRTRDPVSKALFGTFRFGEHELLRITSIDGQCCGAGRDQLVYNLEHTFLHYLQDVAWPELRPGRDRGIAMAYFANWFVVGPLDGADHRSLDPRSSREEPIWIPSEAPPGGDRRWPAVLQFLHLPGIEDRPELQKLATTYAVAARRAWSLEGYELEIVELRRRKLSPFDPPPGSGASRTGP